MAKKTQTQPMKDAYGSNFSQQDLTVKEEHLQPVPLETSVTKTGGVELLATLAKNMRLSFTKKKKSN